MRLINFSAPLLTLAFRAPIAQSFHFFLFPFRNSVGLHKQDVEDDLQYLLSYPSSEFSRSTTGPPRWHHGEIKHWGWTTFYQGLYFHTAVLDIVATYIVGIVGLLMANNHLRL
jgi:hypothetical protein